MKHFYKETYLMITNQNYTLKDKCSLFLAFEYFFKFENFNSF